MPLLNDEVRTHVQSLFAERLRDEVTLDLYIQGKSPLFVPGRRECESCEDALQLYQEVAELSDLLSLNVHDIRQEATGFAVDDLPVCILRGHNQGELRILGLPSGYEFSTLLEDIVDLSTGETMLSEATKEFLAQLEDELRLEVFVTPT